MEKSIERFLESIRRRGRVVDPVGIYEGDLVIPKAIGIDEQWNPRCVTRSLPFSYFGRVRSAYEGYGVLTARDGSYVAGAWTRGRCLRGVCEREGTIFEGEFSGFGTLTLPDGKVHRGASKTCAPSTQIFYFQGSGTVARYNSKVFSHL